MAARKKAKSSRRAKAKKSKRIAKRVVAMKKSTKNVSGGKRIAKKKAAPKRARRVPATETVVVDTVEQQPEPGVGATTEKKYTVRH